MAKPRLTAAAGALLIFFSTCRPTPFLTISEAARVSGLHLNLSILYVDGSRNLLKWDPGSGKLEGPTTGKVIYSATPLEEPWDKYYLIGRRDTEAFPLNLDPGTGELNFRPLDNGGSIPIGTVAELELIMIKKDDPGLNTLAGAYHLEGDLDLFGGENTLSHLRREWTPIGFSSDGWRDQDAQPFEGEFDGKGRTLSNLYINRPGVNNQGLFGYVNNNTPLRNIHVTGKVTGGDFTGGVAGYVGEDITACSFSGAVTGVVNDPARTYTYGIGGVAGFVADNSTACYSRGTVKGKGNGNDFYVGGVAGNSQNGYINCYSESDVEGEGNNAHAGGVAGYGSSGAVACYSTGAVTVTGDNSYAGGVLGQGSGGVIACYSTGDVTVTGDDGYAGGVLGQGKVTACYSTGKVTATGANNIAGGAVGDSWEFAACYWNAAVNTDSGFYGNGSEETNDGAEPFGAGAWPGWDASINWGEYGPSNDPPVPYDSNDWGFFFPDRGNAGKFWKNRGSWNNGNPAWPTLWFQQ